eukprot:873586-Pyramimonas_sp.AAC.1
MSRALHIGELRGINMGPISAPRLQLRTNLLLRSPGGPEGSLVNERDSGKQKTSLAQALRGGTRASSQHPSSLRSPITMRHPTERAL